MFKLTVLEFIIFETERIGGILVLEYTTKKFINLMNLFTYAKWDLYSRDTWPN